MKKKNDFEYTYLAPTAEERKEIESIRNSYTTQTKTDSKLVLLRKLDAMVRNVPTICSLVIAIVGLLLFGVGLTLILEFEIMIMGIVIGVIGSIFMIIAYPIFNKITKIMKNKYSEKILNLSEELLNDEK